VKIRIEEKRCGTTQRVDDKLRGYTAICANPVHTISSRPEFIPLQALAAVLSQTIRPILY
jgi:hypothetical protein